jgi:hypothetical protein
MAASTLTGFSVARNNPECSATARCRYPLNLGNDSRLGDIDWPQEIDRISSFEPFCRVFVIERWLTTVAAKTELPSPVRCVQPERPWPVLDNAVSVRSSDFRRSLRLPEQAACRRNYELTLCRRTAERCVVHSEQFKEVTQTAGQLHNEPRRIRTVHCAMIVRQRQWQHQPLDNHRIFEDQLLLTA